MRHGPKCKIQNYKTSRRQDRRNLGDSGFSDKFLDRRTKTESIKEKKTWTLLILKALYSVKASINRMKKQVTGWENIFANTHQIKVLHMKYPKDLLLQHHHPHGLHARSREGPVPVGSALPPQRPHRKYRAGTEERQGGWGVGGLPSVPRRMGTTCAWAQFWGWRGPLRFGSIPDFSS